LAHDVLRIKLRLPPASSFAFVPGQYLDVIGNNCTRRSYSLANYSPLDGLLELHVRSVPDGVMSDYWFNKANVNDLLRLNGPLGTFFLRECANLNVFFLATGTGIAPIKAMLESLAKFPKEQLPLSVRVLWGGRTQDDFYIDVAAIPGNHRFIPVISRSGGAWAGATGYVQDALLATKPDLARAAVYACGSDAMIHSARARLLEAGLPASRFYSDAFVRSGAQ
jgi:CDP-4-dehydro-6-deoxyglucose reductase